MPTASTTTRKDEMQKIAVTTPMTTMTTTEQGKEDKSLTSTTTQNDKKDNTAAATTTTTTTPVTTTTTTEEEEKVEEEMPKLAKSRYGKGPATTTTTTTTTTPNVSTAAAAVEQRKKQLPKTLTTTTRNDTAGGTNSTVTKEQRHQTMTVNMTMMKTNKTDAVEDNTILMFDQLQLVDKPNCSRNAQNLPQTLEGCCGNLKRWPLRPPNANGKISRTISDMVNILTDEEATVALEAAEMELAAQTGEGGRREEGTPSALYNYQTSATLQNLLQNSRKKTCHRKGLFGIGGHIVKPGRISFYRIDGREYAATEGRWTLMNPKALWTDKNVSLDAEEVRGRQVLILRIPPGCVGRVLNRGFPLLLDVGTHVFNSGTVVNAGTRSLREYQYIRHEQYHYVRVDRGELARVWVEVNSPPQEGGLRSVHPRILKEGEHFVDAHLFKFAGLSNQSDTYIEHGTVHRINVQRGDIAKVIHENKHRLLGEGTHIIESGDLIYEGMVNVMSNLLIKHGTMTIFRVNLGQIALVWQDNEPKFYDKPGVYEFDSPDVNFVEFRDADEKLIQLGSKKIILCQTGEVVVTYDQGDLKILTTGRHVINSAHHNFHGFLSIQQKSIRLFSSSNAEKNARKKELGSNADDAAKDDKPDDEADPTTHSGFAIYETQDLVKVGLRADVYYRIADPHKCVSVIDTNELEDLVRETAIATLTNIVRATTLKEVLRYRDIMMLSDDKKGSTKIEGEDMKPPAAESSLDKTLLDKNPEDFLSFLNDDFNNRYGGMDAAQIKIEIAQSKTISAKSSIEIARNKEGIDEEIDFEEMNVPVDEEVEDPIDDEKMKSPGEEIPPPPSAKTVFERVHDEFLTLLNDDFNSRYGVDIADIRIESFKIMDEELAAELSKNALTTAKIESEMANLEGTALISTTREKTAAEIQDINAKAHAAALKVQADANNQREVEAALAQAEAIKIATRAKAEAAADEVIQMAKAQAEAIRLKADADAQRAELLSQTPFGIQEALLSVYSDMVVQSNQGVQKILYVDSNVNRDSPFALGSLSNLNTDLHSLTQIALAPGEQQQQQQGRHVGNGASKRG